MSGVSNCTPIITGNGIISDDFFYGVEHRTIAQAMTAVTAIAWYNCIVILVLIFVVFKRYSGLYFWSLLITTLAVIPYSTGSWIKQNVAHDGYVIETLVTVGWLFMIPGQSLVLYSRLHLITQNERLLRFILWLIIFDSITLQPTSIILGWTADFGHDATSVHGYSIFEKIQMSIFTTQELIISCTYLWETRKLFNIVLPGRTKNILWEVVACNLLVICLDIASYG